MLKIAQDAIFAARLNKISIQFKKPFGDAVYAYNS